MGMISGMSGELDDRVVSIITPAYKASGTIGATIQSVLAQTYSHWELLIGEDCSPDDTREVVASWAASDPRVRLITLPENGGPAAARNAAIAHARGRWLAFLDADDLWLPEKLSRQLEFHRTTAAKISFTGFRRIDADERTLGRQIHVPPVLTYRKLLSNTAIATSTVIIDRRLASAVHMRKTYYDDFACWLDILRLGGEAVGLDEDLMRYRVLPASVSRNKRNSAVQVWRAYRDVQELSLIASLRHFVAYGFNGLKKYSRF